MARHLLLLVCALLSVDLLPAQVPCTARNPGSVLIYPIHRSGAGLFTVLTVTNSNPAPTAPLGVGGGTSVHFEYVNVTPDPIDPFRPQNCTIFNRYELLTPADTLSVLTGCHNAVTAGGQEGYVVVSAANPSAFQTAWSHNHLIGSEMVIGATGYIYAVNAISVCSPRPQGFATDINLNRRLDFNGLEYEPLADVVMIDAFVALSGSNLTLVNLTGGLRDLNTVFLSVWNDNEFPLSATVTFSCWFDQPLTRVSPLFGEGFLWGTPHDPTELDLNCDDLADIQTGWAAIDSINVSAEGGGFVSSDGVIVGSITSGETTAIAGGRLLWESVARQTNGAFIEN